MIRRLLQAYQPQGEQESASCWRFSTTPQCPIQRAAKQAQLSTGEYPMTSYQTYHSKSLAGSRSGRFSQKSASLDGGSEMLDGLTMTRAIESNNS